MQNTGVRRYLFETKPITSGGKVQLTAKELPSRKRLHRIEVVADCTFTQGAAPATVLASDMFQIVKELRLSKRHIMLGNQLRWQGFLVRGREPSFPSPFLGVNTNVFDRKIRWILDFEDLRGKRRDVALPLTDFLKDDPLTLAFESIGVAGATVAPSCTFTGNVYAIAYYSEPTGKGLPSILAHEYVQWTGKRIVLDSKQRSIVDMFLFKQSGLPFTAAEVTSISLSIDGEPFDSLPGAPSDLAHGYNEENASGSGVLSDTVATPAPAERLTEEPGVAAGAGAGVAPEIIPALFGKHRFQVLDLPVASKQAVITSTGTLSDFVVGVRYLEHRSEEQRQKGAAKAGQSGGAFRVRDDHGRLTANPIAAMVMPTDEI